jgi:hypothetical protein
MKKLFVVLVEDFGAGYLESTEVFHIKALEKTNAIEHVKHIFKKLYEFEEDVIEENLDFIAFELTDDNIIEI